MAMEKFITTTRLPWKGHSTTRTSTVWTNTGSTTKVPATTSSGNLVNDTKEGFGRLKLSNGELFEGEFRKDRIEGNGKFYTASGDIICGLWKDSKLVKVLD